MFLQVLLDIGRYVVIDVNICGHCWWGDCWKVFYVFQCCSLIGWVGLAYVLQMRWCALKGFWYIVDRWFTPICKGLHDDLIKLWDLALGCYAFIYVICYPRLSFIFLSNCYIFGCGCVGCVMYIHVCLQFEWFMIWRSVRKYFSLTINYVDDSGNLSGCSGCNAIHVACECL